MKRVPSLPDWGYSTPSKDRPRLSSRSCTEVPICQDARGNVVDIRSCGLVAQKTEDLGRLERQGIVDVLDQDMALFSSLEDRAASCWVTAFGKRMGVLEISS